jgi:hypothetical protein
VTSSFLVSFVARSRLVEAEGMILSKRILSRIHFRVSLLSFQLYPERQRKVDIDVRD